MKTMLPTLFNSFLNDDFFNDFFKPIKYSFQGDYNIEKVNDNKRRLIIEMPGINKKDLNVSFKEDTRLLTIKVEKEDEEKEYLYKGISKSRMERSWSLPENTKVVDAKLEDGVLSIELDDESPPEVKPKLIEIH